MHTLPEAKSTFATLSRMFDFKRWEGGAPAAVWGRSRRAQNSRGTEAGEETAKMTSVGNVRSLPERESGSERPRRAGDSGSSSHVISSGYVYTAGARGGAGVLSGDPFPRTFSLLLW